MQKVRVYFGVCRFVYCAVFVCVCVGKWIVLDCAVDHIFDIKNQWEIWAAHNDISFSLQQ